MNEYVMEVRLLVQYAAHDSRDARALEARAHALAQRAADALRARGLDLQCEIGRPYHHSCTKPARPMTAEEAAAR